MKKLSISVVLLLCSLNLSAQTPATNVMHNVLGATASSYPGMGLMYQYIFNSDYRVKFAGYYYYSSSNNYDKNSEYNFGVEFQRTLMQTEATRFYCLAGINYYHSTDNYTYYYYPYSSPTESTSDRIMGGAGFGIEFTAWSHLLINFDVGFMDFNQTYNDNPNDTYFGIGGGIGIGYLF